ncbi:MAG TPA: biotin carboxylase N-terminal domain-containing protein [Beutenbergiaceae bacterium]|nr:biotin carboxylase N-terminal domain-containing protein [Beutenbergiaceae bacterium]
MELFSSVLVANRGEIAVRIITTLRNLGIGAVAVFTDDDARAAHVQVADRAVRIPGYLDGEAIVAAAADTGAGAIHPGYGFLAENAAFARACAAAGVTFIGPPAGAIETMGDKIAARAAVTSRGVATVPGIAEPGLDDEALIAGAGQVGFPVLIKPAAGGGGKGMHRVDEAADLPAALATARREAAGAFGDDTLFLERFVDSPRHIEVQVLADAHGQVIHLGERECSLQRRHQKVVEEAPSPLLTEEQREAYGQAAIATARSVGYVGAGTVEFIVSAHQPDEPYFMEMNTRLQVEHPVTEMITGIDLVAEQIHIAAGGPLRIRQQDVDLTGHAIEARVYAEDPAAGFLPTGGQVLQARFPASPGLRVDHAVHPGMTIGSTYDPMIAKVIAHAPTRTGALDHLDRALAHTSILGVGTNIAFLRALLADERVRAGELDTGLIERHSAELVNHSPTAADYAVAALVHWHAAHREATSRWHAPSGWRLSGQAPYVVRFAGTPGQVVTVALTGTPDDALAQIDGTSIRLGMGDDAVVVDGQHRPLRWHVGKGETWINHGTGDRLFHRHSPARDSGTSAATPTLDSPMPGTVVAVLATDGAHVEAGEAVVAVEAMKMEHLLRAPAAGTVRVHVRTGQTVARGEQLARVEPAEGPDQQRPDHKHDQHSDHGHGDQRHGDQGHGDEEHGRQGLSRQGRQEPTANIVEAHHG